MRLVDDASSADLAGGEVAAGRLGRCFSHRLGRGRCPSRYYYYYCYYGCSNYVADAAAAAVVVAVAVVAVED